MADTIKGQSSQGTSQMGNKMENKMEDIRSRVGEKVDELKSRVQETAGQMSERMSGVTSDVAGRLRENRPLLFAGIGLLAVGVGVGIWALIRGRIQEKEFERQPGFGAFGVDEYRRSSSSQY